METLDLLAERAKTHGDYKILAGISQELMNTMMAYDRNTDYWAKLNECQRESLHMIANKIGRILAGNPNTVDHWDDIAGYAKLVADQLRETFK